MLAELAQAAFFAVATAYLWRTRPWRRPKPSVTVLEVHLAETRQYQRLVRFVEDVDDQSVGDPELQELVSGLRGDLVRMAAEGDDDA